MPTSVHDNIKLVRFSICHIEPDAGNSNVTIKGKDGQVMFTHSHRGIEHLS